MQHAVKNICQNKHMQNNKMWGDDPERPTCFN